MAQMSGTDKSSGRDFGDSSEVTNWILDSGATCHMTPQVSDFIQNFCWKIWINIEVADGHNVTAKQNRQVQIKMCNNNEDTCIATFHNILLAPDLCDQLFSIITLLNSGHTFLFHKGFCPFYFGDKENMWLLCHILHR